MTETISTEKAMRTEIVMPREGGPEVLRVGRREELHERPRVVAAVGQVEAQGVAQHRREARHQRFADPELVDLAQRPEDRRSVADDHPVQRER